MESGTIRIYTDGSGINGHVGAAAVAPELRLDGISARRTQYVGTWDVSTVFAAELHQLDLALQAVVDVNRAGASPGRTRYVHWPAHPHQSSTGLGRASAPEIQ
ncbi:uncharacterized protein BBA_10252 [Beauveria bassiana ARSEF 2860]|uniref:RNase H type-1 domain-containing protein n=1 Tax=Beauveria bassiana (strain ARSEF 2860) TaxID=655819 RepID=J4KKP3_BEAB2|nr:uncharacterized protein BBA_10252 [Beauveria bassiana ARSEF 2860]EJP60804.1 hypothetical protein BBA_10252 [Beauveria bassiana ARSEF 2860]